MKWGPVGSNFRIVVGRRFTAGVRLGAYQLNTKTSARQRLFLSSAVFTLVSVPFSPALARDLSAARPAQMSSATTMPITAMVGAIIKDPGQARALLQANRTLFGLAADDDGLTGLGDRVTDAAEAGDAAAVGQA